MSAEGILLEDVNVNGDIRAFSDAVFCVHLQRKYSASRELADYLSANKIDVNNIDDENTMKYLKALQVSEGTNLKFITELSRHFCRGAETTKML